MDLTTHKRRIYLAFCWCVAMMIGNIHVFAQSAASSKNEFKSNKQEKKIPVLDSLKLDSLAIEDGSFSIEGIAPEDYFLNTETAVLKWKKKPEKDSVQVYYRTLAFSFTKIHFNKSAQTVDSNIAFPFFNYSDTDTLPPGYVSFNAIDYNGTYGRSLNVGNNQDMSMNSQFNLQMNGYILDSIRIEAALTDNNIPFQPEGNTQQLQEFDKVYITFQKNEHKLTAGDYALVRPNSYFMNFEKRVQGLMFETVFPNQSKVKNAITFSGSIAKGEFARNIFQGSEGNQGPYKLKGNNGETFFIVLAGSERVYIDGVLLKRGEDYDYVIDYNTAEVTFMPRQLITKEKRIQVEFEYQARNYLNTLFYIKDELTIGNKWKFRWNAYMNQDAKNQPYLQTLDDAQKQFLRGIGDQIDQAFYKVIKEDTFAANKVLYKMVDTTVNGIFYDSIFVYATDPQEAKYSLGFSFVGQNKGNYNISGENTNGRSYVWVAPESGLPQGSYEPIVLLITPKKHHLFTSAAEYQIDSFKKVSVELAASNYAPNLFSPLDKEKHWGWGGKLNYEEMRFLGKKDSMGRSSWSWNQQLNYEYIQSQFKEIAPFRNIEFARDWNLNTDSTRSDEHYISFQTALSKTNWGKLLYNFTWLKQGADFNANRNIVQLNYNHKTVNSGFVFNLMNSESSVNKAAFFRPSAYIEKVFKKWNDLTVGAKYEKEHNDVRNKLNENLLPSAFSFDNLRFYVRSGEDRLTQMQLSYAWRKTDQQKETIFKPFTTAHTIEGNVQLHQIKNQVIAFTGAYRKLIYADSQLLAQADDQNALGRLEYNGSLWKGMIVPNILYELGSGQQQKQEYIYVEVPVGQGMYMWVDYNNDGVQQANEFEIAIYPDQMKYIRVITPTNEYVKVNYVTFNTSLRISPEQLWIRKNKNKAQLFLSRFSNQLMVQINNRSLATEGLKSFNPFWGSIADTAIIANMSTINNSFFFNQKSPKWGMEYNYSFNSGKNLLTYGLEGNEQSRHVLKTRWTFKKYWTWSVNAAQGYKSYQSALPDDRTYKVDIESVEPMLSWIRPSLMRVNASYKYDNRENQAIYGGDHAQIHTASLDMRFTSLNIGMLSARGSFVQIAYTGEKNTPLAFVMLEALQKGQNWLWSLNWERKLGKGIELSLDYEGRKSKGNAIIHSGRMSIRALL